MKRIYFICLFLCLTAFAARPAQAQTETVLYNFCSETGCSDGFEPMGRLAADGKGNFYGTTHGGGQFGQGTVFELSPNGSGGWNETVLYSFTGSKDGGNPSYSYVIFDSAGNLYGTAYNGGNGAGVVFELSPEGASLTETVLYSFCSQPNCPDGGYPVNGLIMDEAGNLYGTTQFGGSGGGGTVFELSPSQGGWTEQVIYELSKMGGAIYAGLTFDASENIFGVAQSGVFELSANGNGGWNSTVISSFISRPRGRIFPDGTLTLDHAGNLYGTRLSGGKYDSGMVYKLSPITTGKNKGKWKRQTLYSFEGGQQGFNPDGAIALDAVGNIYGTTLHGGPYGAGIVFELVTPVGGDTDYNFEILWTFNVGDGSHPNGSLILDSVGNLYGTSGGGDGNVFEVTP